MKILSTISLSFALCVSAFAQTSGNHYTALNGGTNNVAKLATNTYSIVIPCSEFENVGFSLAAMPFTNSLAVGGTLLAPATITYQFSKAMNVVSGNGTLAGTLLETQPSISVAMTFNNTNVMVVATNFYVPGVDYLVLTNVLNPNGLPFTNLLVADFLKRVKRGTVQTSQ